MNAGAGRRQRAGKGRRDKHSLQRMFKARRSRGVTVLVTGGAGYVGAQMLLALEAVGERAVALDDLSVGVPWLVPKSVRLVVADVGDREALAGIFAAGDVKEVIHFAGSTSVPDSLERPIHYYRNNTVKTLSLLQACVDAKVERFIFSSSASVYGTPKVSPVSEEAPLQPISPYGASMMMSERILKDVAGAHGMATAILRYFNVAGADPKGRAGEIGRPTHLLKVAAQIAVGTRSQVLEIYGADYPTPDGTAIRDYVHVADIADAHLSALELLRKGGGSTVLNVGYGRGFSVREVIEAVERVTGRPLPHRTGARRGGDVAQLIADTAEIRAKLDWRPRYDDTDFIVRTAIDWERKLSDLTRETTP